MMQTISSPPVLRWLITLAFVAVVVVLSITPGKDQAGDSVFVWLVVNTPTPLQKFMHFVIYAALVVLWAWTLEAIESRVLRFLLAFLLAVGLGSMLEWYQTKIPGRFGTIVDALLNVLGAIGGLLFALAIL
jgi:VanZ family protein